MPTSSVILIALGLWMGYSGYMAAWRIKHSYELHQRGIEAIEYNYHIVLRWIWWIPIVIALLIYKFS
jgi:hypothetical protein